MRIVFLFTLLLTSAIISAQSIYKGRGGKIKFFSAAMLENIEATTSSVSSVFNESTADVAILISVKSFIFKKKLMQEHFNESYMESEKYPDASFTGKISAVKSLKENPNQSVNILGALVIHGVSMQRDVNATLSLGADGALTAKGTFPVKLEDHKIKIPSLLFKNIAETVEVTFEIILKPAKS